MADEVKPDTAKAGERDSQIRNTDGTFTLAYLAYLVNTKRRKKRRKTNEL
jgi:hypothetical protein